MRLGLPLWPPPGVRDGSRRASPSSCCLDVEPPCQFHGKRTPLLSRGNCVKTFSIDGMGMGGHLGSRPTPDRSQLDSTSRRRDGERPCQAFAERAFAQASFGHLLHNRPTGPSRVGLLLLDWLWIPVDQRASHGRPRATAAPGRAARMPRSEGPEDSRPRRGGPAGVRRRGRRPSQSRQSAIRIRASLSVKKIWPSHGSGALASAP
jgi:hypothetical protein